MCGTRPGARPQPYWAVNAGTYVFMHMKACAPSTHTRFTHEPDHKCCRNLLSHELRHVQSALWIAGSVLMDSNGPPGGGRGNTQALFFSQQRCL